MLAVALILPSYVVSKPQELKCPNGDPFYSDAGSVDANVSTYYLLQSLQPVGELSSALFLLCKFPNYSARPEQTSMVDFIYTFPNYLARPEQTSMEEFIYLDRFRLRSDINFHFRAAPSVIAPRYAQQVPSQMTAVRRPSEEIKAHLGPDQTAMQDH